uniref:Ig-like domain-containing protein n=1 Tax=Chelonoidis abingdonii TaxID=106734 RepID=A0A8C0GXJ4_CHEAB
MFPPWVSVLILLPSLARYYFFPGGANGESVTQPDDPVTVSQGEPALLKCIYDYDASYTIPTLWWYEQHPNEAPRLLLTQYETLDEEERRSRRGFSATPDKHEKTFHLKKNSSELRDSAVYYCAMSDTAIAPSRVAAQKPAGGEEAAH